MIVQQLRDNRKQRWVFRSFQKLNVSFVCQKPMASPMVLRFPNTPNFVHA